MRHLFFLINLCMIVLCLSSNCRGSEVENRLKDVVSTDSLIQLILKEPMTVRSTIIIRSPCKLYYFIVIRCDQGFPWWWEVRFDFAPGDQVYYATNPGGRYLLMFDGEWYLISGNGENAHADVLGFPWDELLEYAGLYTFSETDRRRHAHDTTTVGIPNRADIIKKPQ